MVIIHDNRNANPEFANVPIELFSTLMTGSGSKNVTNVQGENEAAR
ncbi:MAG: hypothetical protein WED04_10330 [Promethearchaeati archaeon SRVP18_Atabeyarchaeia-1]